LQARLGLWSKGVDKIFGRMLHLLIIAVPTSPIADAVPILPGYGAPPTPHFSGFLNASAAEPGTNLHYWFAASSAPDWASRPVVLWLNGGPGSSSLIGMLQEQGPLIIDGNGSLMDNPWAWTTVANMVALESPGGVGYSYCAAMVTGGSCANTDISTAKAAAAAIADLFATKFPELRSNPFFITGESYAGVYSPTLAAEIVKANEAGAPKINLVGMAVGDPCTDNKAQADSMDMLWYAHKNGLVPDGEFDFLWNTCHSRAPSALSAGAWRAEADPRRVNVPGSTRVRPVKPVAAARRLSEQDTKNCTIAYRKFLVSSSKSVSQSWDHAFINELSFYSPAAPFRWDLPESLNGKTAAYMNRDDVKKALHVEQAPVAAWPGPAEGWSYTSSYDACNGGEKLSNKSMVDFYRELSPALPGKIVVFNGDTDPCVSYEGTRTALERVGFDIVAPMRPWFFNATATSSQFLEEKDLLFGPSLSVVGAGAQFGGEIVDYEHNLSFATVHGSGHMVPTFRPRAALKLLKHVVEGSAFAPAVLSDAELGDMTDAAFDTFLDTWVLDAKTAAYVM